MKKLALSLLAISSIAHAAPAQPVNALDAIMDAPRTVKFQHLAPMQHVGIVLATGVATAIGYITFLGIAKGLGYKPTDAYGNYVQTARFFEPTQWQWIERIGALTGGISGAYYAYGACMPQSGWDGKDREVLQAIVTITNEKDLLAAIDLCFVNEHFGRASAFAHLVRLSNKLRTTKEIFMRVDKTSFAYAIDAIDKNLVLLNKTILLIKSQPNWLDESRAQALSNMATTQKDHHNAQLLGTAVYLANS